MTKKLISMSEIMADRLQSLAKEQGTTQSRIIETALTLYTMIQIGAPLQAQKLQEMIPKNQIDIFELLEKKIKKNK
jgi:predicted transcriptional regulator